MKRDEYNYWLANIHNIGVRKINRLLEAFGSAEGVFLATRKELIEVLSGDLQATGRILNETDAEGIINSRQKDKINKKYAELADKGIQFISREDELYPAKLKEIYDAPFALYAKGKLPEAGMKYLAVIGARDCSPYGMEMARYLAGAVASEGIGIISGLARGIDAYAHEGALAVGGITYGILGCGINICYPKENINLFMEIQKEGGIISEYAPGVSPISGNFPMRNRIISGLSDGILVIEAREKSGSLITVDMGLDQGKDIYALPGKATDRLSAGCNNLIKTGAKLVTAPEDILEDYIQNYEKSIDKKKINDYLLETDGKIVYASLGFEPKHIEEIATETTLPLGHLMEQLLLLELRGMVRQTMKNYYVLQG